MAHSFTVTLKSDFPRQPIACNAHGVQSKQLQIVIALVQAIADEQVDKHLRLAAYLFMHAFCSNTHLHAASKCTVMSAQKQLRLHVDQMSMHM